MTYLFILIILGCFLAWNGGPRALIVLFVTTLAVFVREAVGFFGINEWLGTIVASMPLLILWMCMKKWQIPKNFGRKNPGPKPLGSAPGSGNESSRKPKS